MQSKNYMKMAAAAAALAAGATVAQAAEETANLSVTATVLDTCTITAATGLAFATISTQDATDQATPGSIVVLCTAPRASLAVAVGGGENASGGTRYMADSGANQLPYQLHKDSGHTQPIAIDGSLYSGSIGAAVPLALPVYGQIPQGDYNAGLYSDTILVSLTY